MTHMGLEYLKHQESSRHNLETESHARNQLAWDKDIGTKRLNLDTNIYNMNLNKAKQGATEYANQLVKYINDAAARGDELAYQSGLDSLTQMSNMYDGLNFRADYDDKTQLESLMHTGTRIGGYGNMVMDNVQGLLDRRNNLMDGFWYPVEHGNRLIGGMLGNAKSAVGLAGSLAALGA